MMELELRKRNLIAPITALAAVESATGMRILIGSGGTLRVYDSSAALPNDSRISDWPIFDTHSIHGIKSTTAPDIFIIFGDKSVTLVEITSSPRLSVRSQFSLTKLDDLVLDCHMHQDLLLIGHAHNFIDYYRDISTSSSANREFVHISRVQGADMCVLFSLSFAPACDSHMLVASGTAFGKIIIWSSSSPKDAAGAPVLQSMGRNLHTLTTHEGVIFRLVWSPFSAHASDKCMPFFLASVSDDRTVRLWQLGSTSLPEECNQSQQPTGGCSITEMFVGWGHASRLWDCAFIHPALVGSDEELAVVLATSSEDGSVKVWHYHRADRIGRCIATLRGHTHHIWRLLAVQSGQFLVTGGNEGGVRVWDVDAQLRGCSQGRHSRPWIEAVPDYDPPTQALPITKSRRNNGVNALRISPDGTAIIVATNEGCLWLVVSKDSFSSRNDNMQQASDSKENETWKRVSNLDMAIMAMDCMFADECIMVLCAHPRGRLSATIINSRGETEWSVGGTTVWVGHALNLVNVWKVAGAGKHRDGEGEHRDGEGKHRDGEGEHRDGEGKHRDGEGEHRDGEGEHRDGEGELYMSASIQGLCKLWRVSAADPPQQRLIAEFATVKGDIASSCATFTSSLGTFLAVGDVRGSVSIFLLSPREACQTKSSDSGESASATAELHGFLFHVHELEPVQVLVPVQNGLLCAGNDGCVVVLRTMVAGGLLRVDAVSVLTCLPIRTPDSLFIIPSAATDPIHPNIISTPLSLYITGYQANEAVVFDIHRSYQVLQVEGGGRRRPHHAVVFMPHGDNAAVDSHCAAMFACPVVDGAGAMSLCVHSALPAAAAKGLRSSLPPHILPGGTGRVLYSGIYFGNANKSKFLAVGGEDGHVRVLRSNDLSHMQTLFMPMNISVKTISTCSISSRGCGLAGGEYGDTSGVLVAAGGRLTFSAWTWGDDSFTEILGPLRFEVSGNLYVKGSGALNQDHRILCSAVQPLYEGARDAFTVLFCDSRGAATISTLHLAARTIARPDGDKKELPFLKSGSAFTTSFSFAASEYPILCCKMASLYPAELLLVLGDSSGEVMLWSLSLATATASLIHTYSPHAVGTNCLTVRLEVGISSPLSIAVEVVSGGDDQAIGVARGRLCRSNDAEETCPWSLQDATLIIRHGAAGAAIQSIVPVNALGTLIASIACDQRISIWDVTTPSAVGERAEDAMSYVGGMVVNVGDVAEMTVDEDGEQLVIVGEGVQQIDVRSTKSGE